MKLDTVRAEVEITNVGTHRQVRVTPKDSSYYVPFRSFVTTYPVELVEAVLAVKGADYLIDEIRRHEDPAYVELHLAHDLFGYVRRDEFVGKRLLDFGCGCGSSTLVLARLLPQTTIVGVELEGQFLELARKRAKHFGLDNIEFVASPDPASLPDLQPLDFIVLSAVYEHLLPRERGPLMRALWKNLAPDGVLFLDQTPHRYWPIEAHTTGLPLLNYLPDRWARRIAPLTNRVSRSDTWDDMLRAGIRGATVGEIGSHLDGGTRLRPLQGDEADLWYAVSGGIRASRLKAWLRLALKPFCRSGAILVPYLSVAFRR